MPYKDPVKQREYQREWAREKAAAKNGSKHSRTLNPEDIKHAQGLRDMLSQLTVDVMEAKGDIFMKARLVAYLASVSLKVVETADLEVRLAELEQLMKGDELN